MRISIILNGAKKKSSAVHQEILKTLAEDHTCHFEYTKQKGDGSRIAREYADKSDIIIAAGGDGTLHECINGLMSWKNENQDKAIPLFAPLPLGSGNDFCRNLSISRNISDLRNRILHQQKITADIGLLQFENSKVRYFLNEGSLGLGPAVVKKVETLPAHWSGNIKFGLGILQAFLSFKKIDVELQSEAWSWKGKAMAIVFANGKYFGSGIGIAPDALINDGVLNVTIIGNVSLFDYLKYLPRLKAGKKIHHPEVHYFTTKNTSIKCEENFESDGELSEIANAQVLISEYKIEILQ